MVSITNLILDMFYILLKSLGLTSANSVLTPGVKDHDPDYELLKSNEPDSQIKIDDADSLDSNH